MAQPLPLDLGHREWGDSRYLHLVLTGVVKLSDALNQLHVLLPVLDESKHYWQGPEEVDKLIRSGEGWLADHPENELITRRYLGRTFTRAHGLAQSLAQLEAEPEEFRSRALAFMGGLISHYVLDDGRLVVVHAGLKEAYHGRSSGRVRAFALYGDTTGETDDYGLPVRYPWARRLADRVALSAADDVAVATSRRDGFLEHREQAFEEYAGWGVSRVVCEEKHMGSRAIAVIARDARTAERRFGVTDDTSGTVYTRTGRPFFADTGPLVDRLRSASAPLFDSLDTDWLALDCELLLWSAKALGLITSQYASVGAAAREVLPEALAALEQAARRGLDVGALAARTRGRLAKATSFRDAYAA